MTLKSRTRSNYRYFLPYRTRWNDNDQYGHLNNSVYSHLIDSIVTTYLIEQCGYDPKAESSSSPLGSVIYSQCSYFSPISFPAVVDLGLRVNQIGNSSVIYEVGFFEDGKDAVSAVGGFVHVFMHRDGRKPVTTLEGNLKYGLEKVLVREGDRETRRGSKL